MWSGEPVKGVEVETTAADFKIAARPGAAPAVSLGIARSERVAVGGAARALARTLAADGGTATRTLVLCLLCHR